MARSAVVFVADRLGAGYLGPYGNSWLPTPTASALAAESLLVEFALADSPELATVYRSYWTGRHALDARPGDIGTSLGAQLGAANIATLLVTDERRLVTHPQAGDFARLHRVESEADAPTAEDVEKTQLAQLVYTAIDRLEDLRPPFLLWIHAQAMEGPWDAPYDLRERLAAEEDPEPPRLVLPPACEFAANHDPDELLGWTQAYGGQVMLLDMALSALVDALGEMPFASDTLLAFTSPRGYPLGEHGIVGSPAVPKAARLYGEQLQVPLLLRFPDRLAATLRTPSLAQPPDLHATLLDWFGLAPEPAAWGRSLLPIARGEDADQPSGGTIAASIGHNQRALRTPDWFLRGPTSPTEPDDPPELFVKPDDRLEVNEISDRCRDELEQMTALADRFAAAVQTGRREML